MMPGSCAAGINVMCGDNDSDLPQIIELERQAWPFKGRWCEMWETACDFTGHCNQPEDGQHILAGVVSTSVAQACKMEKKEQKDEQMNASALGQTMSCHSFYINRIMRLSMPDDAAPTKIAALANALPAYVGDNFQQGTLKGNMGYAHLHSDPKGSSIYADSVDIPISGSQVCQTSHGGSYPSGCQPNLQRGLWGHATQAQDTSWLLR